MCWTCISVSGSCSLISFASLHKFDCFLAHLLITHHTHTVPGSQKESNQIWYLFTWGPTLLFPVDSGFVRDFHQILLCVTVWYRIFAYGFDLCDHPVLNFSFLEWVDLCDPHTFELFRRSRSVWSFVAWVECKLDVPPWIREWEGKSFRHSFVEIGREAFVWAVCSSIVWVLIDLCVIDRFEVID